MRRELEEQRKRGNTLELELNKLQRMHEHKVLDMKAMKTALKTRDNQLQAAQDRIKDLEGALAKCVSGCCYGLKDTDTWLACSHDLTHTMLA